MLTAMGCPHASDTVQSAVKRCPFLGQIAADHGEAYACSVAVNPARPTYEPVLPESLGDFRHSFHLFHGAKGIVPLIRSESAAGDEAEHCSHSEQHSFWKGEESESSLFPAKRLHTTGHVQRIGHGSILAAAPFASLSTGLSRFLPGPEDFLARQRRRRQDRKDKRAEAKQKGSGKGSSQNSQSKIERWRHHPVVGGLIPLNAAGKYACPPLIVAGRAAVAKLRTTKLLRPQALPVKLLGVGGHCLASNIPCGAVREHTEKFSVAWFLAVHATVPFFAFMRKGVGMPKWGIALTLAAAIAGQTIGAKLERARLAYVAEEQCRRRMMAAKGLPCVERAETGQKCPVLKTCAEIAQSHYNGSASQQAILA